jgi:hypothetical protein
MDREDVRMAQPRGGFDLLEESLAADRGSKLGPRSRSTS